ncbi:MAG: glycosyltransferase [Bacteroidales bacterium]|nr:glycosyltransferase [Bacteroidales bacterium]
MNKISVVMPVYNAEEYVSAAIDSVLKQSFRNFEFIIIDDGSTDRTLEIIQSYKDKRMVLLQNEHDFVGSLNKGLHYATGKYIARMDADDIMHVDRLRIQYRIMEEEPSITVCGTWINLFGESIQAGSINRIVDGRIEYPVIALLKQNLLFHPTTLIRKDFLEKHHLQYQHYDYAEDYKLWFEIAKNNGVFYVESQPLLFYRISETQVSQIKEKEQNYTSEKIKKEIIEYLIEKNQSDYPELESIYRHLISLADKKAMSPDLFFSFYFSFFTENKNRWIISG